MAERWQQPWRQTSSGQQPKIKGIAEFIQLFEPMPLICAVLLD
ncbi:hypothetical protein [Psychrobacter immobilis]|nr:hypothetical protein [Psychrobacter immobilis]